MVAAQRTYLDHNATSPLRPQARAAMLAALDRVGNPSSVHAEGRAARALVESARETVAGVVGAAPSEVTFTSGGTEANVAALMGQDATRLLVGATEHACVLDGHGFSADAAERLPVLADGRIDLPALSDRLDACKAAGEAVLVAVQLANNETGVVQPIRAVADLVHAAGFRLHCDAVQALGKVAVAAGALDADTLAFSAHKVGGPQGIGALVVRRGARAGRLMRGGGQERGLRAGTENVAAIAGFAAAALAAREALAQEAVRLAGLRDQFEAGLRAAAAETVIFGGEVERLPNTTLFALPGLAAETALIAFDLAGVAVSSGAACSSGKVRRSHVLTAMGCDGMTAGAALRASFGWTSTGDDVAAALKAFANVVSALRVRQGRQAA